MDDKRLYTVTVEVEMQVLAENERKAGDIGGREAREEIIMGNAQISATPTIFLPSAWAHSFPWGGDGGADCETLMAEQPGTIEDVPRVQG